MSAPLLTSSSPTSGASGVFLNAQITLTFSTGGVGLDSSYVNANSFLIRDLTTNKLVELDTTIDVTNSVVTLTAKSHFKTYQAYRVFVLGTDSNLTLAVRDISGNALATTIQITFTTGDQLYTHDQTLVTKTTEDLENEGDLYLPSNLKVISGLFYLLSSTPTAWSHNQDASTVTLRFSKEIEAASLTNFSISWEPMLTSHYVAEAATDEFASSYTAPTGTWALDPGDSSIVTWTADAAIPRNLYATVEVSSDLTSTDGDAFSGADFGFNSLVWPTIGSIRMIRREIPAAIDGIRDDYLGALLLKNALYCYELTGGLATLTAHSFPVLKYVINQTIVDVLDDKELEKALAAGTRRQLGDLNVSIDSLVGKAALKHARALAAAENALASIIKNPGVRVGTFNYVMYDRLWWGASNKYRDADDVYRQEDLPAANRDYNRQAKIPPYEYL